MEWYSWRKRGYSSSFSRNQENQARTGESKRIIEMVRIWKKQGSKEVASTLVKLKVEKDANE